MTLSQWSTSPSNNASGVTNVNWAEGMAPAQVNDSARQQMADVATWYRTDAEWIDRNDSATYVSSTQIKFAGTDLTSIYNVNRQVRAEGLSVGTIYGNISASAYSSDTTVTIDWDNGSTGLANETITSISVGIVSGSSSARSVAKDVFSSTEITGISTFTSSILDSTNASSFRTGIDAQEDIITTRGDIITGSSAGSVQRLAIGSTTQFVARSGSDVAWRAINAADLSGVAASEVNMESETANKFVTSDVVINSPFAAKFYANINASSTSPTLRASQNVSSVTYLGSGLLRINFSNSFTASTYSIFTSYNNANTGIANQNDGQISPYNYTTSSVDLIMTNGAGQLIAPEIVNIIGFGTI